MIKYHYAHFFIIVTIVVYRYACGMRMVQEIQNVFNLNANPELSFHVRVADDF